MIPSFAASARFDRDWPNFAWDEWDIEPYYANHDPAQLARLSLLSGNANHALMCACGYWIVERFRRLDLSREAEDFLDVAAVSTYEAPAYEYFEIDDEDWRGPIRGPLALMITISVDALYCLAEDPEPAVRACYMYNLCRHVLSPDDEFLTWFEASVRRLERSHRIVQAPLAMPSPDLVMGLAVPVSAFEPRLAYSADEEQRAFALARQHVNPSNPFLVDF
ncbi:MAG: hypothetical protein J0L76_14670 [Rhodobacterales bacterium]|nr:hypothetical protein [Rhodobacterales bacterium]